MLSRVNWTPANTGNTFVILVQVPSRRKHPTANNAALLVQFVTLFLTSFHLITKSSEPEQQ